MAKGGESNIHSTVMQQILESRVAELCPTLHDPMDCSLLGSSVHGIFQEKILDLVSMPSSRGSSQPRDQTQVSCIACEFFTAFTREAHQDIKTPHFTAFGV